MSRLLVVLLGAIARTVELGADYGHNARLAQEQQLIQSINKFLGNGG
jgi:homoserine acetyltransferase